MQILAFLNSFLQTPTKNPDIQSQTKDIENNGFKWDAGCRIPYI